MLELYHAGLTSCSKKARLCLVEKGLDYVSHYMNLGAFEHHRPDYLAINPNGVVPSLVHDGTVIIESTVINEYVDEVFPEPALRPADPAARARMRVWGKMADEYGLAAIRIPTWTRTKTANVTALNEADELDDVIARVPLKDHRDKYRAIADGGFSETDFADAYARMDFIFERAEAALAEGPWLAGETYSLADINVLPYIDAFAKLRSELGDAANYPRVAEWLATLWQRPAVIKTYNPSDEAPARPPAKQSAA